MRYGMRKTRNMFIHIFLIKSCTRCALMFTSVIKYFVRPAKASNYIINIYNNHFSVRKNEYKSQITLATYHLQCDTIKSFSMFNFQSFYCKYFKNNIILLFRSSILRRKIDLLELPKINYYLFFWME